MGHLIKTKKTKTTLLTGYSNKEFSVAGIVNDSEETHSLREHTAHSTA